MNFKILGVLLVAMPFGTTVLAQTPSSDQLSILKSLPADTQNSLIQSVLGKGDGAGTKIALGDVVLRDGDKLVVPKKTQEITILGEVQSPTSHVYQEGLTRDDYVAKSGGLTQKADKKRIYVARANGDVVAGGRSSGWFRRTQNVDIHSGDAIIVPLDAERVRALPLWQAGTTILYNIAIGVLALKSAGL